MRILNESGSPLSCKPIIVERKEGPVGERLLVRGPSQRVGIKNENGRVYPKTVWEKNLAKGSRFSSLLQENKVLGELEHPESGNTHLARVSHLMKRAWIETLPDSNAYGVPAGEYVMTENLILNTPNGRILKELFEVEVPVGISSRGRGDTYKEGEADIVDDNYEVDCWDYVYRPSVQEAHHNKVEMTMKNDKRRRLGEQDGMPPPPPPPADSEVIGPDGPIGPNLPPPGNEIEAPITIPDDKGSDLSKAQALVDKYADLVRGEDVGSCIEVLLDATEAVDDLGGDTSEEAIKLRGQLIMLVKGLLIKVGDALPDSVKNKPSDTAPSKSSGAGSSSSDSDSKSDGDSKKSNPFAKSSEDKDDDEEDKEESSKQGSLWVIEHIDELVEEEKTRRKKLVEARPQRGSKITETSGDKEMAKPSVNEVVFFRQIVELYASERDKNKRLRERFAGFKDMVSRDNYDKSVELCAEITRQSRELVSEKKETDKKYRAALMTIEALTTKFNELDRSYFVAQKILDDPRLAEHEKDLVACESKEAIETKITELAGVLKERTRVTSKVIKESTEPLPNRLPGEKWTSSDKTKVESEEEAPEKRKPAADLFEGVVRNMSK